MKGKRGIVRVKRGAGACSPRCGGRGPGIEEGLVSGPKEDQEIEGILDRILFHNEATGWGVLRIIAEPGNNPVTATGTIFGIEEGERVLARGTWVIKEPYGLELQMSSCVPVKPQTARGIEEYLSSGFIKGVGSETAKRLVGKFGVGLIDIIENHPGRLTEVSGIGPKRAHAIHGAWKELHEMSDIMIFLQSHGVTAAYAYKIYRFYGRETPRVIQENPYRLTFDIFGIGFKTADRIARGFGVPRESPGRARAGVVYALGEISEKGHACCPEESLVKKAREILEVPEPLVRDAVEGLWQEGEVRREEFSGKTFLYLRTLHEAEKSIDQDLKAIMGSPSRIAVPDIPKAIGRFEETCGMELADEQREALTAALTEKVLVITGGPGTGKTTLIRGIIEILERRGLSVLLCAPTGRAAKRMSEATLREAKTIHRLFELAPGDQGGFGDSEREIRGDVLIIDETSMVDTLLFSRVLKGIGKETTLILVGDADQLPPVGPGSVLLDIIRSGVVKTVRLTTIFRQASESLIIVNAHRINQGFMPHVKESSGTEDFFFIHRENPQDVLDVAKELVANRIPRRFGLDPVRDVQVLCPMHKGLLGVENLNVELQALLNPDGNALIHGAKRICEGDKVMQLRNNYDQNVFNGDMGTVLFVDPGKKIMDVDFENRIVRYEGADMDELAVAYACSIHKAQGNEFPAVVLVLHTQHGIMLQRNLLYTAVTRGRKLVTVVGNRKALEIATANVIKARRHTLLGERLKGLI
jgi:exodeoxyribonuclease V alpha subunit